MPALQDASPSFEARTSRSTRSVGEEGAENSQFAVDVGPEQRSLYDGNDEADLFGIGRGERRARVGRARLQPVPGGAVVLVSAGEDHSGVGENRVGALVGLDATPLRRVVGSDPPGRAAVVAQQDDATFRQEPSSCSSRARSDGPCAVR